METGQHSEIEPPGSVETLTAPPPAGQGRPTSDPAATRWMLEALGEAVYVVSVPVDRGDDFHFTAVNQRFLDATGADSDDLIGHRPQRAFGREDGDGIVSRWRIAAEVGRPFSYTVHLDGKILWTTLSPVFDEDGSCVELIGVTRDDTNYRGRAERLRSVFDHTSEGVALLDRDHRFVEVIRGGADVWGRPTDELVGEPLRDTVHAEDEGLLPASADVVEPGEDLLVEARVRSGTHQPRWREFHLVNLLDDPQVEAVLVTTRDCHERRQAQLATEEAEQRYRSLIAHSADALVGCDAAQRIVLWNRAAQAMFGYPEGDILGEDLSLILPERAQQRSRLLRRTPGQPRGGQTVSQFQAVRSDGSHLWVEVNLSKAPSKAGPILLASIRDVTRRVEAEDAAEMARRDLEATQNQLIVAQKHEAVGQLAAGIAHEINTPMQYIGDNTRFLQESVTRLLKVTEAAQRAAAPEATETDRQALVEVLARSRVGLIADRAGQAAEDALQGVASVAGIVAAMKRFSHPGHADFEPVDINDSLQTTLTVCRNEWKYAANVEADLDPDLPTIEANPNALNQVWLNMIVNATHAIADRHAPNKGTVRIRTRPIEGTGGVAVTIADDGIGIPEAARLKIFDQFFTTKEVGRGTGQGLSIALQIVAGEHGGTIDVDSEPGRGTTFTVTLPARRPASPADGANPGPGRPGRPASP